MPMTSPRCCGGNHPITSLPLAELLLAAAMPPRKRNTPTVTSECADAAANAAAAVSAEPSASTMRSPIRSTTHPQAMSVVTMPKLGNDDIRPACARSRPRSVCRVGIMKATPLMKTLAHRVALNAIANIDHRREVPIVYDVVVMLTWLLTTSHDVE